MIVEQWLPEQTRASCDCSCNALLILKRGRKIICCCFHRKVTSSCRWTVTVCWNDRTRRRCDCSRTVQPTRREWVWRILRETRRVAVRNTFNHRGSSGFVCPSEKVVKQWAFQTSKIVWVKVKLFRSCHSIRTVLIDRTPTGSLGCSIVGGCESGFGLVPIFVKTVVPGTPAALEGILRYLEE